MQSCYVNLKSWNLTIDDLVKSRKTIVSAKQIFIVETKGQEDLDVPLKIQRLRQWCEDINRVQTEVKYNFVYVDEEL